MLYLLGLSGAASNLRNQEINTKRRILVFQVALEFRDLLPEHVGCVPHSSNDSEAASVGDRCCEFGAGGNIHTSKEDRVVDFEEVGDRGTELFCGMMLERRLFKSENGRLTRGSHVEGVLHKVLIPGPFSPVSWLNSVGEGTM